MHTRAYVVMMRMTRCLIFQGRPENRGAGAPAAGLVETQICSVHNNHHEQVCAMIEAFAVVGAALGAAHTSNDPVLLQCFPQLRESALPPSLEPGPGLTEPPEIANSLGIGN